MDPSYPNNYGGNNPRPHSGSSHDSSISSATSSQTTLIPPPSGMFATGTQSRTQLPPGSLPQHHSSVTRSPAGSTLMAYGHQYGNSSTSPSTSSSVFQDAGGSTDTAYASAGMSPTHMSPGASSQKRPYRQRRKDPSCDVCRERKVKCDATEMQSCTECTTRSVQCQFTKETNRRMSSIKQVQDLQAQLAELKEEMEQLKAARREEASILNLPEIRPTTERKSEMPALRELDGARQNTRLYGKAIFKPPPLYRQIIPPQTVHDPDIPIPPRLLVDKLLHQYYYSVHRLYPILHWPTFQKDVEQLYVNGTWEGIAQVWGSMFYAVLACGTLQTPESSNPEEPGRPRPHGIDFMRASSRWVNTWTDEIRMDHARAALLICHFMTEMNMKSAGWVWLGSCVRISQDIGLHIETGPWGMLEEELRRRLWWCTYAIDRFHSLENGKPTLINDEDCQVGWPCPIDDEQIDPRQFARLSPTSAAHTTLATVIPVVRFISQLKTTLKSRRVANQTLLTYDDYFEAVMSTFPEMFRLHSTTYLEPYNLTVAFFLQAARFHLYRHNLSPICSVEERKSAMDRCYGVAKDTVRYISRTLQTPPVSPGTQGRSSSEPDASQTERWQSAVRSTAINASCAHLWRCALMLTFRGDFPAAIICVRVSTAIGPLRNMNMACGKHLKFFLDQLLDRWRTGRARPEALEQDEEMIAYMSGDLQGSSENSWIWAGSETGSKLNANKEGREPAVKLESQRASTPSSGRNTAVRANGDRVSPPTTPTDPKKDPATAMKIWRQSVDWGGWETVEPLLHNLIEEQARMQPGASAPHDLASMANMHRGERGWDERSHQHYHQPAHNAGKRRQLGPPDGTSARHNPHAADGDEPAPPQSAPGASSGASRISIANII